jgi:hypothetical protein
MGSVLYLADQESPLFSASRTSIDVVCAGDSITGRNNFGGVRDWPYRTYPEFLPHLGESSVFTSSGLNVANGGIAVRSARTASGRSGTT